MGILKESIRYYKELKAEEKNKRKLLSAKTDFHMLEELIQKVNENPYLRIEVRLKDGTSMLLKTYLKDNRADLINGEIGRAHV